MFLLMRPGIVRDKIEAKTSTAASPRVVLNFYGMQNDTRMPEYFLPLCSFNCLAKFPLSTHQHEVTVMSSTASEDIFTKREEPTV